MNNGSITTVLNNDLQDIISITYQNKNILLLIKLEHPSLCGERCSFSYFY